MAVNVSTRQLLDHDFVDADVAQAVLLRLRETGVKLVLDDFGTGYSSLQHLKAFPLHGIKIDRGFVAGMGHDAVDESIVQSVTSLARALQFIVVAEGVETEEQRQWLLELGCGLAQGFLFARPRPADALRPGVTGQPARTAESTFRVGLG